MNKKEHGRNKNTPTDSTARRSRGDDSPERDASENQDARGSAHPDGRTEIGPSAGRGDAREADNTVLACPECDKTGVKHRAVNGMRGRPAQAAYYCRHCATAFDEPVERERRGHGHPSGLAGKLLRADPDAVSADHAGEPMTDGGVVLVCPACDQPQLTPVGSNVRGDECDHSYLCSKCGHTTDTPRERESRSNSDGLSGLAKTLSETDADDVGRPATDGGPEACQQCGEQDWGTDSHFGDIMCEGCGWRPRKKRRDEIRASLAKADGGVTSTEAAALVEETQTSADPALTHAEQTKLDTVVDYLRNGIGADADVDEELTDTRIEVASKLRCLADDLERAARHSSAGDVEVTLHVAVEETYRDSWGGQ